MLIYLLVRTGSCAPISLIAKQCQSLAGVLKFIPYLYTYFIPYLYTYFILCLFTYFILYILYIFYSIHLYILYSIHIIHNLFYTFIYILFNNLPTDALIHCTSVRYEVISIILNIQFSDVKTIFIHLPIDNLSNIQNIQYSEFYLYIQ